MIQSLGEAGQGGSDFPACGFTGLSKNGAVLIVTPLQLGLRPPQFRLGWPIRLRPGRAVAELEHLFNGYLVPPRIISLYLHDKTAFRKAPAQFLAAGSLNWFCRNDRLGRAGIRCRRD